MDLRRLAIITSLASICGLVAGARAAQACGGTFCDQGPQAMPVDQTGENILFVQDGQHIEAHIQIQYDPDTAADQFAWVIPVQEIPQFSVGSEQLFRNLLDGTVPTYGYSASTNPACIPPPSEGPAGSGFTSGGDDGGWAGDGDGDGGEDEGPEVVFTDTVGAFDIVVLDGGTAGSVMDWLGANGYEQDPDAEPIIEEYLEEGLLFVALKLVPGAGVDELQPIVLEFDTGEPCVPLRLTRIAAQDDMEVRTFFMGDARAVPSNYRHVQVNPLMIDWASFGANYKDVIVQAVDANVAEGRAFVSEYAGTSDVVWDGGLEDARWDPEAFLSMQDSPTSVIAELEAQGLIQCFGSEPPIGVETCSYPHALLPPILDEFLPVPDGLTEAEFYGCLDCYEALVDQEAWDAGMFSTWLDERIVAPGRHAAALLQTWPYVTRMYTLISPHEMTEDPIFITNPDLADVGAQRMATVVRDCVVDGRGVDHHLWTLPDGRQVKVPSTDTFGATWFPFESDDAMPWEEEVEQGTMAGPNQVLVDNTPLIDERLATYNAAAEAEIGAPYDGAGCGCVAAPGRGGIAALGSLLGLGLLGLGRRRRR